MPEVRAIRVRNYNLRSTLYAGATILDVSSATGSYPETLDPYRNCPERTACINLQELVVGQFR